MKKRVAVWAGAGFLVAVCWGLYFASVNKDNPIEPIVYTLARLTLPVVAIVTYFNFPFSLHWTLIANAATYALVGLIVENVRKQLNHAN